MATSAQINSITALYAGYFDRAPDPAGLQFWISQIDNGRAFNTIAADFAAGFEARALYPFLTTPDVSGIANFVNAIYANLFNRAPDTAGFNFWTGVIQAGTVPVADMIESIINGARDDASATPPSFDKTTLDNKVVAGLDFATDAGATPGFVYDANAAAAAKAIMDTVTNDGATIATAAAQTDTFLAGQGAGVAGSTLTLQANVADQITGTANDDIIRALSSNTLESADVINGGAGTDTLNIASGGHGSNIAPVMSNVEIVNDADSSSMDLTSMSGIQQYWSTGTGNTINNAALSTIFGTSMTTLNSIDINILESTTGSSDTLQLAARDNTNNTIFTSSSDAASIEIIELSALGGTDGKSGGTGLLADDFVNIDAFTNVMTIKVKEAGDINIGAAVGGTKISSLDTTGATGYVRIDAQSSTQNMTMTGGSSADDITLGSGNNTANSGAGNDIIEGGTGTDLIMTGAGSDILGGNTGTNTLDGGAGADTMVGAGIDTFIITTDNTELSAVDLIVSSFSSGSDKLEFNGAAGTATNYMEAANTAASYSDALSVANGLLDGTVLYATVANNATGRVQAGVLVFADTNGDGTADHVVNISAGAGGSLANIDFGDII